jgi:hypothetical protein
MCSRASVVSVLRPEGQRTWIPQRGTIFCPDEATGLKHQGLGKEKAAVPLALTYSLPGA